jgi:hypothetical protein
LTTAVFPALATAQGGPPLITDDPDTPGPGYWEINVAMLRDKTRAERRLETPRLDLNYGVGRRVQLKFEIPWVALLAEDQTRENGAGSATVGVKWRFVGQEGDVIAWSIYPQLDFILTDSTLANGIEDHRREFILPTELTVEFFHLEVNAEVGRTFAGEGRGSWLFGLSSEGHVVPRLELLAEIHGDKVNGESTALIAVGGGRFKLTTTAFVLLAVGHSVRSLPDQGPRTYAYMGLQFNLPHQFVFDPDGPWTRAASPVNARDTYQDRNARKN